MMKSAICAWIKTPLDPLLEFNPRPPGFLFTPANPEIIVYLPTPSSRSPFRDLRECHQPVCVLTNPDFVFALDSFLADWSPAWTAAYLHYSASHTLTWTCLQQKACVYLLYLDPIPTRKFHRRNAKYKAKERQKLRAHLLFYFIHLVRMVCRDGCWIGD